MERCKYILLFLEQHVPKSHFWTMTTFNHFFLIFLMPSHVFLCNEKATIKGSDEFWDVK